jgi:hypothetical protein
MGIYDSPALLDPALFWGGILVILFYLSLRGFAALRELKTLPEVHRCPSVISRKDAKTRSREEGALSSMLNCIKPFHFLKNPWVWPSDL